MNINDFNRWKCIGCGKIVQVFLTNEPKCDICNGKIFNKERDNTRVHILSTTLGTEIDIPFRIKSFEEKESKEEF